MNANEKANDLVNQYRMILMNEDTDCGNEIICSLIAIESAKITANEMIEHISKGVGLIVNNLFEIILKKKL